jgi:hypothetical protein
MAYKVMILNKPTSVEVDVDHDDEFSTYSLTATVRGARLETDVTIDHDSDDCLTPRMVIDAITEAYVAHLEYQVQGYKESLLDAQGLLR